MKKFVMEKKLVAQVRYYERLFCIKDKQGQRVYTGTDEKLAEHILKLLNGYELRKAKKRRLTHVSKKKYLGNKRVYRRPRQTKRK